MGLGAIGRFLGRKGLVEWAVLALLLVGGGLLGHHLSDSTIWVNLRYKIYQATLVFGHPARYPQATAAVLLNDDDYWSEAMQGRVPTRRDYLASIVRKLDDANVNVIALDFDLRSPRPPSPEDFSGYRQETDALVNSITEACQHQRQIVLAASVGQDKRGTYYRLPSVYEDPTLYQDKERFKQPNLDPACVHSGYIQLPFDVRRIPGLLTLGDGTTLNSFALAVSQVTNPVRYSETIHSQRTMFPFSRFISDPEFRDKSVTQSVFTGAEILAADKNELARKLVNRTVFIGADWHTLAYGLGSFADDHGSPGGDMAGTLLHANYVEAILANDGTFPPASKTLAETIDVVAVLSLVLFGMLKVHPGWKLCALGVMFVLVLCFSYIFLQTFGLFLDFFFPLIILVLHVSIEHIHQLVERILEWRHEARHAGKTESLQ